MFRKLFLLFILVAVIVLFEECCKSETFHFRRKKMFVEHAIHNGGYVHLNDFVSDQINVDTSQIYILQVDFEVDYIAFSNLKLSKLLINNSYASKKCDDIIAGSYEEITSINITSNTNFDSSHLAGQNLNKFFRFDNNYSLDAVKYSPANTERTPAFPIILINKPTADSVHTFKVDITLSNGETFSAQSPQVTFKKR